MARRNILLRLSFAALCAALFALACWEGSDPARPGADRTAWSVQLHTHGSFSEGMGSVDSHSYEAQELGVDAIWWSDHDFRITSYQHVDHFGFEAGAEPIDAGEDWRVELRRFREDVKTIQPLDSGPAVETRFVTSPVHQGERSLLLRATETGDAFRSHACLLAASRKLHRRPLAGGVSLRLWVHPDELTSDARPFVSVLLSEHAPGDGLGFEQIALRYVLVPESSAPRPAVREGNTFRVSVPAAAGRWNELSLPISADAVRGFPFLTPGDDALFRLIVGVEARAGATAEAAFDDLSFEHERRGAEMFALQRTLLDGMQRAYPEVRQLQGVEVSYASRHLNEYSLEPALLDYDAIAAETARDADDARFLDEPLYRKNVVRRAVEAAHARGGLISYNHLFGVSLEGSPSRRSPEVQLEMMMRNRGFGADLLEVGYRDRGGASLTDHLWVWDQMAAAGMRPVGTGVSDSHGGPDERWSGRPNNFVSWIYAPSSELAELLEGLRAGRVYFGDIERWDGQIDIDTDHGQHMGQELVTDRARIALQLRVTDVRAGDSLRVIEGGEEVARHELHTGEVSVEHHLILPEAGSTFVRFELHGSQGGVRALSNPLHFLRPAAVATGAPLVPARTAIDLLGLVSSGVEGFTISSVAVVGEKVLRLGGTARAGRLTFEFGERASISSVRFKGLAGTWEVRAGQLCIEELAGEGTLEVEL